jgi:hypothetical protein
VSPADGSLVRGWEVEWSKLGYMPEQFGVRRSNALLVYGTVGSAYMVFVLGGFMLWSIRARAWPSGSVAPPGPIIGPGEVDPTALQQLWQSIRQKDIGANAPYAVVLNGEQVGVSQETYTSLINEETRLIRNTDLFINMVKEEAYLRGQPLHFSGESRNYYLACVYAGKEPGIFYSNSTLRSEIIAYLGYDPGKGLNESRAISDFIKSKFKAHPIIARKGIMLGESKVLDNRSVFLIKSLNNQ